jgi:uncharacterized 2Fe-2S/4Fe-4S cluster protein (DUF4445 family)
MVWFHIDKKRVKWFVYTFRYAMQQEFRGLKAVLVGPVKPCGLKGERDLKTAMVIFQPSGRRGLVPLGISVVEASRLLGVDIEAPCGEMQICGKCKIRIEKGDFEKFGIESRASHAGIWQDLESAVIGEEERQAGYRLGCVATVQDDLLVYVPEASRAGKQVVSKAARPIQIDLDPAVKHYVIEVKAPTLADATADLERVLEALKNQHGLSTLHCDVFAMRGLPRALRTGDWQITVSIWMDREIIRFSPGKTFMGYGLAIDIGTTTLAAYLCDLNTGAVIDTLSMMNPQVRYGEDVVSRITYHMGNPGGLERMSADLVDALNQLVEQALSGGGRLSGDETTGAVGPSRFTREDILDVTIGCNTAMHHILLRLDPEPLGSLPFTPVVHHSLDVKARDLGLRINPSANVFFLPNTSGYVGGDNIGVILAEELHLREENQLIIDIGTNGELVLGNKDRLICSSCATGPALEGAQIEFGMRAAPGAIERVTIDPDTHEVDYKVIGRDAWRSYSAPEAMQTRGVCGSGILDVLAQLFLAGFVCKNGAFSADARSSGRFRENPETGIKEFVLAWANETIIGKDIVITQKDIRQIQLAKASIYTGCKLMMRSLNLSSADQVKIAGAFGTHVDRRLALVMGMIPDTPLDTVTCVGNAAGDGCRIVLLDRKKRHEADKVCRNVTCIELTLEADFQQQLIEATQLPHMRDHFPHLRESRGDKDDSKP